MPEKQTRKTKMTTLNASFKTQNNGRSYSGCIVNGLVKLSESVYYNGVHSIVTSTLLNGSVPLAMASTYREVHSNDTYRIASNLLCAN